MLYDPAGVMNNAVANGAMLCDPSGVGSHAGAIRTNICDPSGVMRIITVLP